MTKGFYKKEAFFYTWIATHFVLAMTVIATHFVLAMIVIARLLRSKTSVSFATGA